MTTVTAPPDMEEVAKDTRKVIEMLERNKVTLHRMNVAFMSQYMNWVRRFDYTFTNIHMWNGNEADILGVRPSRFIDEVEVKTSKSDFRADFKKSAICNHVWQNKHKAIEQGIGYANYFSFYVPEDMEQYARMHVPDYAGLYVFYPADGRRVVEEVKKAPRLHTKKLKREALNRYLDKMYYRYKRMMMERKD